MAQEGEPPDADEVTAIGALAEPNRRALYDVIAQDAGWVSRDQAADAVGIARATAAHHLDRLADEGLLEVDYRRLSGRRGPGAGRPAKVYRRARRDFEVSLPPRDYELAGRLLAEAADRSRTDGTDITTALDAAAGDQGRSVARAAEERVSAGTSPDLRHAVIEVLRGYGFEPHEQPDGSIVLRNCPFHQLSRHHTELVCGMNLSLLTAAVDEVGGTGLSTTLEPTEGLCCVRFRPTDAA
jgi:predicted ArsR family transcriptional regulator